MATVTFGDFEWDADKATANAAKHGVLFEEAVTGFLDLDYLLIHDGSGPELLARHPAEPVCQPARRLPAHGLCGPRYLGAFR